MKKTLSIILTVCIILGLFGTVAFADTTAKYAHIEQGHVHIYDDYYYANGMESTHSGKLALGGNIDTYLMVYDGVTVDIEFHNLMIDIIPQNYYGVELQENSTVNIKFYGKNEISSAMNAILTRSSSKVTLELADNSSVKIASTTEGKDAILGNVEMKDGSALPDPDANGDIIITKGTPTDCEHTSEYVNDSDCGIKCGSIIAGVVEHDVEYAVVDGGHVNTCINCKKQFGAVESHTIFYNYIDENYCYSYCDDCTYEGEKVAHQNTQYGYYDEDHCILYCYNCGYVNEQTGLVKHNYVTKTFAATEIESAYTIKECEHCKDWVKEYDTQDAITFELTTELSDWDNSAIIALKNGVPLTLIRNYDGYPVEKYAIPYDKDATYSFYWLGEHSEGEYFGAKINITGVKTPIFESDDMSGFDTMELLCEYNVADYTKLDTAMATVPEELEFYTKDSVNKLVEAIKGIDYYVHKNNQSKVDAMAKAVTDAVAGLVPTADPETLGVINLLRDVSVDETGYKIFIDDHTQKNYDYEGDYTVFSSKRKTNAAFFVEGGKMNVTFINVSGRDGTLGFYYDSEVNFTALGTNIFNSVDSGYAGIEVVDDAKLTITKDSENIIAIGDNNCAGIGSYYGENYDGEYYEDAGDITIDGGVVFALSIDDGAGIGGAYKSGFGKITINGGRVHAECTNNDGAGIGVGDDGNGGDIVINGGDITALSLDDDGAGIGGADSGHVNSITINGGNILVGTDDGAAIGAGEDYESYGGKITINGGVIKEHFDDGSDFFIGNTGKSAKEEGEDNYVEINGGNIIGGGEIIPAPKNKDGKPVAKNEITLHGSLSDKEVEITLSDGTTVKVTGDGEKIYAYLPEDTTITNERFLSTGVIVKDTTKVFKDVKAGKWYSDAIDHCYSYGLIKGVEKDVFGIDEPVTRGMFITVLARMAGVKTSGDANKVTTKFTDVKSGKYYTNAIKWASDNKIVNGTTDTTFEPDTPIERQQLCTMIVKYAKFMDIEITAREEKIKFADESAVYNYAKKAVEICQQADILNGIKVGKSLCVKPTDCATRAQAAKMLYVFHDIYVLK